MIGNSSTAWGWPAKTLHWMGAVMILILLLHGWWMTHMTPRPERLANYAWHSALGYDLLVLFVLRLLWRWMNTVPDLPVNTARWERIAAHAGHAGLYLLMIVTSLSGWVVAATFRTPMLADLFGLSVPTPAMITSIDRSLRGVIEETHKNLAYVLAALVILHIAAALWHHFAKKNDVLRRML